MKYFLPSEINAESSWKFGEKILADGKIYEEYEFDFKEMNWVQPYGALYISGLINYMKNNFPTSKSLFSNVGSKRNHSYAAHIGFFESIGVDYGNKPGVAAGSPNYIPITQLSLFEAHTDARNRDVAVGAIIDDDASRITEILMRQDKGHAFDAVQYSIREIIRNSAEHSNSQYVYYCAQYYPKKHQVEIAIMDWGIGIPKSLEKNPYLNFSNDAEALKLSLLPSISGKFYEGVEIRPYDEWQNSGYGLYMINRISCMAGDFFIGSGQSVLHANAGGHEVSNVNLIPGTSVFLRINTDKVQNITHDIQRFGAEGREQAKNISESTNIDASAASLMLRSQINRPD